MTIEKLFDNMWQDYLELNPDASKIYQLFNQNNKVVNDHVAFRTFGLPGLRVEDIAQPLVDLGYTVAGEYDFEKKKLRAKHYAHPTMPLVFISELKVEEFSREIQILIKQLASQVDLNAVKKQDFLYSGRPWSVVSDVYERLLEESEYAAWVAAFGFRATCYASVFFSAFLMCTSIVCRLAGPPVFSVIFPANGCSLLMKNHPIKISITRF